MGDDCRGRWSRILQIRRPGVEDLDGTPVINLTQVPLRVEEPGQAHVDIAISASALVVLAPLLALIAAASG